MQRLMPIGPTDTIGELPFSSEAATAGVARPSETECRVIGLYEQFRNSLLRYVLSFGLSVQDGEEIAQETFLALFRHLQLGKSQRDLRAWIFRVAHNLALKQRHANQRSQQTISDWTIAETQVDPLPNPEEQASFTQGRRRLLAVFHALSEGDQFCLKLRAEGLRYREIAAVLEISLGAVSTSLTRSLARMARADGR